jgi:hypothetical protein
MQGILCDREEAIEEKPGDKSSPDPAGGWRIGVRKAIVLL